MLRCFPAWMALEHLQNLSHIHLTPEEGDQFGWRREDDTVVETLRAGYDVEGRRQGGRVVEVLDEELTPGEFPFGIGLVGNVLVGIGHHGN